MNEKPAEIGNVQILDNKVSRIQEDKTMLNAYVEYLKASLTRPETHRVPVRLVLRVFRWFGFPDLTAIALGDAFVAHGVKRIKATHTRIHCIPGLDYSSLVNRILEAKRGQQVAGRGTAGCPIINHVNTLQVECEVSGVFSS